MKTERLIDQEEVTYLMAQLEQYYLCKSLMLLMDHSDYHHVSGLTA